MINRYNYKFLNNELSFCLCCHREKAVKHCGKGAFDSLISMLQEQQEAELRFSTKGKMMKNKLCNG